MPLKCPICGKEYFYEAKICQSCNNYSINSNLITNDPNKRYKWNCNYFFDDQRGIFSNCKSIRTQIKLIPEPKDMRITLPQLFEWNCDISKYDSKVEKKARIPLVYIELDIDKERENSYLIYE
ncbi:MAG: hypothetical protein ACFE8L_12690 [Candidatus Hodarchaeota archaeon]